MSELKTLIADAVKETFGTIGNYTFLDGLTLDDITVCLYEDVVQFDDMGAGGTQTEIGIDVNDISSCKSGESVLIGERTYIINGYLRKVANFKRYWVV